MKKVIITIMFIQIFITPLVKKLLKELYPPAPNHYNNQASNNNNKSRFSGPQIVQAVIIECGLGDYPFYASLDFNGAPQFLDKDTPNIMWEFIECDSEDDVIAALEGLTPQQQADSWVLSGDMTDGLCKSDFVVIYPTIHPEANTDNSLDLKPANPQHTLYKPDEWPILQQVRDLLK